MITKEELFELMSREEVAIKCENEEQWNHVYNEVISAYPDWDYEPAREYQPEWPYLVYWCGTISGFNGQGKYHPARFTYEEFVTIINQIIVPEEALQGLEEIL